MVHTRWIVLVPRRWLDNPFFYQKKNGLSPGVGRTTRFFTKKKRAVSCQLSVKPIFKKNGLLSRFFTKKKRAIIPFFYQKKTGCQLR